MDMQTDFLELAKLALINSSDMSERADNSENYAEFFLEQSQHWQQQAQAQALVSLAQDVRRIANALEQVIETDDDRVLQAAVRIWGGSAS